ncbi:MAG: methyltransferase domain-containing protein [Alphaproteobacteria bacterium]|nr:methyltransferase domain-containing protein [Alphaproteobacteria bacterium]
MTRGEKDVQFWNRAARKYAADPIADMAGYERTLDAVRRLLKPGDAVYEFGCGTGMTALKLAPSAARMVATDASAEMIAIARERLAAAPVAQLSFAVETPAQSRAADGSFDVVLGFNILHLIEAREAALRGVHRLLKPGSLFISKTPCLKEMNPLIRVALPVLQMVGKAPYVSVLNATETEREIAAAGFEIVERGRHGARGKDARIFLVARKA